MFKLYNVKARLISRLGHVFNDETLVRAMCLEAALVNGMRVLTAHGEEAFWMEVELIN